MSIRLLYTPLSPNIIADDVEGAFWTLLYGVLSHFVPPAKGLPLRRHIFSQTSVGKDGLAVGGRNKRAFLLESGVEKINFRSAVLKGLVCESARDWWNGLGHGRTHGYPYCGSRGRQGHNPRAAATFILGRPVRTDSAAISRPRNKVMQFPNMGSPYIVLTGLNVLCLCLPQETLRVPLWVECARPG
ncbi:hypothetical protein PsYK624_081530 [Phanerochaete sordida]|uniref:Uncharacterized protein n=1 Tax=Phanerochaete sordida TaxID=48140 RepID=A0A9P3GC70_9APHY|nr:hypothetical protein PsYK624_081530 [Phanerochaete sordida]